MKIERTKNAARNMVFGWLLKIYQILIPFLMRTAMIYFMGIQYLGLNSLFSSILQVLNLAELGVGNALVFSMYKPIAENDAEKICGLMNLYKRLYRMIGMVILAIGMILLPFVPKLIHGDVPKNLNIYVLYLLYLATTVLSYWLFAYKNALLTAHQREDVISKVTILTNTIQYALQLAVIIGTGNYYLYLIVYLGTQILTNIITAITSDHFYPEYRAEGELDRSTRADIMHRIRDLFTSKIGAVVLNSADTIVISAFLGLTVLAVYQNYFFIVTAVIGFLLVVFQSCMAGIGNSLIVETEEKNFEDLKIFTFLIVWISGWCMTCFLCLFQPFMNIWVGKKLELGMPVVCCICLYFYLYEINQLLNTYKDAAGIWHQDRFRPLATALTNLGMNLMTVKYWGLYGVMLSTVLSMMLIGMPWLLHNLFSVLFDHRHLKEYIALVFRYSFVAFLLCGITFFPCSQIHVGKWMTLLIRAVICIILPNLLYFALYRKTKEFERSMELFERITHGRLKLVKIIG